MYKKLLDISVAVKVGLAPAFAVLCLLLLGAVALVSNARLTESLTDVGDVRVPRIAGAGALDGMEFDRVFTDKASGKDTHRPQLQAMLGHECGRGPCVSICIRPPKAHLPTPDSGSAYCGWSIQPCRWLLSVVFEVERG